MTTTIVGIVPVGAHYLCGDTSKGEPVVVLQCRLRYVYHDGERAEFVFPDGKIAREQILAEGQYVLILHQERRIVYSDESGGMYQQHTELYPDYVHEINANVKQQFVLTERPCDCTNEYCRHK